MKIFSRTTQNAIISLLFFGVSLAVAFFTYYLVDREGSQLESQMEVLSKNRQLQEHYSSLEVMVQESQAEYAEMASYLLTENNTINFLSEIETLAGDMGLALTTDALKVDPLPNPKYQGITLQLRIEGAHDQVLHFLQILEVLPYYSRIEALTLQKGGDDEESWVAAVTLLVGLHTHDQ